LKVGDRFSQHAGESKGQIFLRITDTAQLLLLHKRDPEYRLNLIRALTEAARQVGLGISAVDHLGRPLGVAWEIMRRLMAVHA
jgi:hypothetical protein